MGRESPLIRPAVSEVGFPPQIKPFPKKLKQHLITAQRQVLAFTALCVGLLSFFFFFAIRMNPCGILAQMKQYMKV